MLGIMRICYSPAGCGDRAALPTHHQVDYLAIRGAWVDQYDSSDDTPLHLAARHNHPTVVSTLLQHHAKPDLPNKLHLTPFAEAVLAGAFEAASEFGHTMATQHLLAGYSLLQVAAGLGRVGSVRYLVQRGLGAGSGVNWRDAKRGATALHCAMEGGHVECVQLLLELGADPGVHAANGAALIDFLPATTPHRDRLAALVKAAVPSTAEAPTTAGVPRGPLAYGEVQSEADFKEWFKALPPDK